MRKVSMIGVTLLVAAFCVFHTRSASGQTKRCALTLSVSATNKYFETRPVNGARATALNTGTHKSIPAVLSMGEPLFPKLPDGQYRITVTKLGFKRAVQPVSFTCELMNARATLQVDLAPGNFRRSVVASSESVNANQINIPPVRRGITTILGTESSSEFKGVLGSEPPAPGEARPRGAIAGGVLNGKAVVLPKPAYPAIARQAHASGIVTVQVVIDEEGNVISAHAVSGHPLLQAVSVEAARNSKFSPTRLSGQPVKVTGVITYNFVAQ